MVRNKEHPLLQVNKMDKYAVQRPAGGTVVPGDAEEGQEKDRGPGDEPSLSAIMAAIPDLHSSLEPKLDAVTVDVNLLFADLEKVTEKVINGETDIAQLQSTSRRIEDQVQFLTTEHEKIMARLEDQEGRAQRNNIRVVGVPERAEGPSVEFFLETLIVDSLRPKRLSKFFTVERVHRAPIPPRGRGPPRGPSLHKLFTLEMKMPSCRLPGRMEIFNMSMLLYVSFQTSR
ncbi:hypothetical protein NDU88_008672 [Pleurodeles waltl]|uniref:Uncharacterized protein n=1 Tax=Pleurodeles waltl TaxID=8319 RepID=A0AAV7RW50_PLEWA|nr:hypothetical protein NDU88_008672 [Pleurodeles waltl]